MRLWRLVLEELKRTTTTTSGVQYTHLKLCQIPKLFISLFRQPSFFFPLQEWWKWWWWSSQKSDPDTVGHGIPDLYLHIVRAQTGTPGFTVSMLSPSLRLKIACFITIQHFEADLEEMQNQPAFYSYFEWSYHKKIINPLVVWLVSIQFINTIH